MLENNIEVLRRVKCSMEPIDCIMECCKRQLPREHDAGFGSLKRLIQRCPGRSLDRKIKTLEPAKDHLQEVGRNLVGT